MAARFQGVFSRTATALAAAVMGTVAAASFGGCATRVYRATDLPAEFVAPHAQNVETLDLSRLATYAVSNDLIDRGDVLEVTIITDYANLTTTTAPVRVMDDGTGKVPVIGRLPLAGLKLDEAEQLITAEAQQRQIYPNAHVIVTMERKRVNRVSVLGPGVEHPGPYEIPSGNSNLLAAITAAGGLTPEADSHLTIRRPASRDNAPGLPRARQPRVAGGPDAELTSFSEPVSADRGPQTIEVNLAQAASEGRGGYYLDDGDVVMVPKAPPKRISVQGLVNKPDQYELPPGEDVYLLDAVAMANGQEMSAADNVLIIRQVPGQDEPVRIRTSVHDAKYNKQANVRLAPGDVVSLEETPLTLLLRTIKNFVRVGLSSSVPLF